MAIPVNRNDVLNKPPKETTKIDDIAKNWTTKFLTFFCDSQLTEKAREKKGEKGKKSWRSCRSISYSRTFVEVLEEAEAEEQEVETCSNEDSDKENITFVADYYVLVQFQCPNNKTNYYVGRITSVVDNNLLVFEKQGLT